MNPELEKLIDLLLADGELTDKEKNVIFNKAAQFGIDKDEIEVYLDGRLFQLQASQRKPSQEKFGIKKVCPSCGAAVKALSLFCTDCGHEFSSIKNSNALSELMQKLNEVNIDNYDDEDYDKKLASIVKKCVIPSTAEDIYEFGIKAISEISTEADLSDVSVAWKNKAEDCIMKLKLLSTNNPKYIELLNVLETSLQEKLKKQHSSKIKDGVLLFIVFLFLFGLFGIIFIFF